MTDKILVLLAGPDDGPRQPATVWSGIRWGWPMPECHVLVKGTKPGSGMQTQTLVFRCRHTRTEWRLEMTIGQATILWTRLPSGGRKVRWRNASVYGPERFHRLVARIPMDPSVADVGRVFGKR